MPHHDSAVAAHASDGPAARVEAQSTQNESTAVSESRKATGVSDQGRPLDSSGAEKMRATLAAQPFLGTMVFMKRQSLVPKKRRGPPPTGHGIQIQVRIKPEKLAELDRWIRAQSDNPSRPEAIRRMVERTLSRFAHPKAADQKKAQKASELAARAAEHVIDKSIPLEEQQRRKRALIKGPKEFREIREDLPKPKR